MHIPFRRILEISCAHELAIRMPNIHSLSDLKKRPRVEEGPDAAQYYAGGVGNDGGGSGVAIQLPDNPIASILEQSRRASAASGPGSDDTTPGIHIEMYRNGFVVVNRGERGPFRSVLDPKNHVFLADIRRGQTPSEIARLVGQQVRRNPPARKKPELASHDHAALRYCARAISR